jgi:DNA-directed RNA polymerase subunit M/transcription elongation factor TFIIS
MASPQATSSAEEEARRNLEQITFRFCSECSNMLYPKEDEDSHKLQFTCRTCQYTEEATSTCVFRNVMNNAVGETAGVTQDVGSDPTVRINVFSATHNPILAAPQAPLAAPGDPRSEYISSTSGSASSSMASMRAPAQPSMLGNPATCMRCGCTLLHCHECHEPASVEEYNDFVTSHGHFVVERTIHAATVASIYQCLDLEHQASWDQDFIERVVSSGSWDSENSITQYLPYDIASNPDADPPEALGVEPEVNDLGYQL